MFENRRGETYAIAREPWAGAYLRLSGRAGVLASRLDGTRTLADLADDDSDRASVERIVGSLRDAGLLAGEDRPAPATGGWIGRWREPTLRLPRADALAGMAYRRGGYLAFTRPALVASAVLMVTGAATFASLWVQGGRSIVGALTARGALVMSLLLLAGHVLHELGHALVVKHVRRTVVGAGFQLYLGLPALVVDSTDMLFASRRARIANSAAGPYVEAVVAGAFSLAAGLWPDQHLLFRLAAWGWAYALLNLVPFIEADGYWLLTDLLDTPRLRPRAFAVLRRELPRRLGRRRGPLTRDERGLAVFGALSTVCTAGAVVVAVLLWWPLVGAFV